MQTSSVSGGIHRFYVPLSKIDEEQRMCYGYASTDARDSDGDIITRKAMEGALPDYLRWSNIREMHQLSAVGTAESAKMDGKGLYLSAKITDDDAWKKVKAKVYKGFSIGGRATKRDDDDPHTITGLELVEISLVDRPANPDAKIDAYKMFKAGDSAAAIQIGLDEPEAAVDEPLPSIEEKAKDLCKAAGKDPEGIMLFSKIGAHVLQWHTFQKAANEALAVMQADREMAKRAEAKKAVDGVSRQPEQVWACGMLAHGHTDKDEALACILEQDTKFGKTTAAIELRKKLAAGIDVLDGDALVSTVGDVEKHTKGKKKDKAEGDDDPEERKNPPMPGDQKNKAEGDDGDKPYGDVDYADPGHQEDKKKRYPIDTAEHIRAAWNYISKDKNQSKYTPGQVSSIKGRIVSAWKAKIDKEGPPSAEGGKAAKTNHNQTEDEVNTEMLKAFGPPDAKAGVKKGLYAASLALGLLGQLDSLAKALEAEAAVEKDDSALPERFSNLVTMMSELVKSLVEEEIGELLDNKEIAAMDGPAMIGYAKKPLKMASAMVSAKVFADELEKALGDNTGSPGFATLTALAEEIAKDGTAGPQTQEWGNRKGGEQQPNDKWTRKVQSMHDECVGLGAKCDAEKAAGADGDDADADEDDPKKAKKAKAKPKPGDADYVDPEDAGDGGDDEGDETDKAKAAKAAKAAKIAKDLKKAKDKDGGDEDNKDNLLVKTLVGMQDQIKAITEFLGSTTRKNPPAKGSSVLKGKNEDNGNGDGGDDVDDTLDADGKPIPSKVLAKALSRPNLITR